MSYITSSLTVIITLISVGKTNSYSQDYMYYPPKNYTRLLELKQGYIQGVVVSPDNRNGLLSRVEHYRGIPYAAPPVGELRFMPPSGAPSWDGIKYADTFGPVCPQMFPSTENMAPQRLREFARLKNYLNYQLEDCLYLNVYVPHNPDRDEEKKYPVIVFIHGESYEWNSGNPYDGSVLAAYAKVVVVTFNFRLGILGFLKIDSGDSFNSNFGLVDQIAALVWVRDNIEVFGGDPESVTLLGHGTGAACANLLMLSPMIKPGNKLLCHRAILMGGTAIADWALASNPRDVTDQVARALQCEVGDKACLRGKRLDEIMGAHVVARPYSTRFGPIVDSSVVPNDPLKSMTNLSRFQLMFGVTEWESKNMLGREELMNGMPQKQRDQELLNYLGFTCEKVPDLCSIYSGSYYENKETVRDNLLDILSDARTVAPMLKMGILHSSATSHSYFYVFTHKTKLKEHLRGKTSTGEELPYVFGVPLDGSSFHFVDNYTKDEVLFSKVIMTYIRNFAYGGNPNAFVEGEDHQSQDESEVLQKMQYWPQFTKEYQSYFLLDIPIATFTRYRLKKVKFWNEDLPRILENLSVQQKITTTTEQPPKRPKGTPPFILRYPYPFAHNNPTSESYPTIGHTDEEPPYGNVLEEGTDRPDTLNKVVYGTVINSQHHPSELQKATTMNIIVICGGVFLLVNFFVFMALYYKCYMVKKNQEPEIVPDMIDSDVENPDKKNIFGDGQAFVANGGGLIKMISKSSKSDDVYEAVKLGSQNSKKHKLVRQLSNSTIDAHTKVKDWIANGITLKNSPKDLKKPRNNATDTKNKILKSNIGEILSLRQDEYSESSTLGRSPTRPVSPAIQPAENIGKAKQGILKQNSHNSSQDSRRRDKVSVAIDATPSGRGPSVLAQQPIELSKSLDLGASSSKSPLRRSATMEDFSPKAVEEIADLTKSVTSLISQPTIVKISHSHSKSDPVEDIYVSSKTKKLKTFDPEVDVNVTSCDEKKSTRPLSPEESLMTIKRRNFPKVLPDYPTKESLAQKRRSMPAPNLSVPINDLRHRMKMPPAPPVRTTSTLGRKPQTQPPDELVCNSAPVLLEENSSSPEPEFTYNNLYVGPLIPKNQIKNKDTLDTNPIYSSLSALKKTDTSTEKVARVAIVTTDPKNPIKKPEPKTVIRPKIVRQMSDPKSRVIPRVTATDNMPGHHLSPTKTEKDDPKLSKIVENNEKDRRDQRPQRLPMIPTPVRSQNNDGKSHSSSETSPSEESDTGTVVAKRKD
ncbi:neuroligin-4, Y-linked-like isoform X2 [Coccinella septempunctata]|nr:neuroligin-4, Y-linked-like isoform X2 [Coccinella septempunctata]XP_044751985.1 neuroligin-4, Y-linked-like isoform X2 [Coccinella septempunctata]XP_044751986.1 neuroligin-4, Y-linked-like isoform X2 [Coccinella septempunctata]